MRYTWLITINCLTVGIHYRSRHSIPECNGLSQFKENRCTGRPSIPLWEFNLIAGPWYQLKLKNSRRHLDMNPVLWKSSAHQPSRHCGLFSGNPLRHQNRHSVAASILKLLLKYMDHLLHRPGNASLPSVVSMKLPKKTYLQSQFMSHECKSLRNGKIDYCNWWLGLNKNLAGHCWDRHTMLYKSNFCFLLVVPLFM